VSNFTVTRFPWSEPLTQFDAQAQAGYCVWLDSATVSPQSRFSILASAPFKIFKSKGNRVQVCTGLNTREVVGNPFDLLAHELALHSGAFGPGLFPVGAAIGYFGYDLKNQIERLPAQATDDLGLPDCWFGFYDRLLVFDHEEQVVTRIAANLGHRVEPPAPDLESPVAGEDFSYNFTRATYRQAVLRAKEYIARGDIYQVNLSQRFQCGIHATAVELYRLLREANPAPYCAYLDTGAAQILSSSPECFLNMSDRQVITRPIKGTRARHADPAEDQRIAEELMRSPKDNAELVMITDLERNDLGRVCEFGSVHVSDLVSVESYATVHHLVSTVGGQLRAGVSHVDAVRACFPGGSITGAPKIRAMEIIDELEPHARGVYTGAIGFFGFNGVSHFNIAIRTVVQQGERLTFHAGGGIVADSEPDAEYAETLAKAQGIFNAIGQLRVR
jgi:para-aminobenzoate synthetase component I